MSIYPRITTEILKSKGIMRGAIKMGIVWQNDMKENGKLSGERRGKSIMRGVLTKNHTIFIYLKLCIIHISVSMHISVCVYVFITWTENMIPKSHTLSNKNPSASHEKPNFKLLVRFVQETPKII